jgi:hypothetical protein
VNSEREINLTARENNLEIFSCSDKSYGENSLSSLLQIKYDFHQKNTATKWLLCEYITVRYA